MTNKILLFVFPFLPLILCHPVFANNSRVDRYNLLWTSQSKGSHESMPCGGGDIGLNVWVEQNDVLFYFCRSGSFDENNSFLKSGRIRIKLLPNPLGSRDFTQELKLEKGCVEIKGGGTEIQIWVDVFRPLIHVEIVGVTPFNIEVFYENWRYEDRPIRKGEANATSYKWVIPEGLVTRKDSVVIENDAVCFFHKNDSPNIFDKTVAQQGLEAVKSVLYNPLEKLIFGGKLWGDYLEYNRSGTGRYADTDFMYWSLKSVKSSTSHHVYIALHTAQENLLSEWKEDLDSIHVEAYNPSAKRETQQWWSDFWERSFVLIDKDNEDSSPWKIGRNYQLFRYMLGCNAYGSYPTKFNGGLFTFDPCFVDTAQSFTPDYRKWGGGTFTAQNQRLVHFPMLKSGDFDLMKPQFDFYLRLLKNAETRTKIYWGHKGACFTEQLENFGLPNPTEYGWKRPEYFDKGVEYNAWLEYQWDTVLEFCLMILETKGYCDADIVAYLPLIKSCLTFFDEHYRWLAERRGIKSLDQNGHLVLYPGSACETYKMAYNASSTVSALKVVLEKMIDLSEDLEEKDRWTKMLSRIPPLSLTERNGKKMIAPAKLWERINNEESPQLYPVFPWRIYGIGKKDLDVAVNTYYHDPDVVKFRNHVGWKQDNIFAACLGLTEEAKELTLLKMADGPFRFPAFWGPGFDWAPDHNWGGSGMIGLQEMLIQTVDDKIYLFPAWPEEWDVHFKLHVDKVTTVEVELVDGKLRNLIVSPSYRSKDIVNCIQN
jgi:hypothetical protein